MKMMCFLLSKPTYIKQAFSDGVFLNMKGTPFIFFVLCPCRAE